MPPLPRTTPTARPELDDLTLARAERGDTAAFRALVGCYQDAVFGFLWRMLGARGDRGLVEDLSQDVFVNVHRALPRFSTAGPARLGTWILTIATRIALNALRRHRPPTVPLDQRARAVAAPRTDAALALIVRDALDQLSPDHRAVLVLREFHDLDYDEIAGVLGVEVGTVRSRLSRARAALRDALGEGP